MAKFITSNELNSELERLFENAEKRIILISPFIKLHDRYASVLSLKKEDPDLHITVVFGKNEEDLKRSMSIEDLTFFTEFANIDIRYERRLHAKYYANDFNAIITSMNLYKYSQDNNIEAGILTKPRFLGAGDKIDGEAYQYFERIIDQSVLVFKREPKYEKGPLRIRKKYTSSKTEVDKIKELFTSMNSETTHNNFLSEKAFRPNMSNLAKGFCIRTGQPIPFNMEKPLCREAFEVWNSFGNFEYPENYCHFSGEPSNGETTYARPVLYKNWGKAKDSFKM